MHRLGEHHDDHARSAFELTLTYAPNERLNVADSRLGLDANQLCRDAEQQIPRAPIAGNRQWHLRRDLPGHVEPAYDGMAFEFAA